MSRPQTRKGPSKPLWRRRLLLAATALFAWLLASTFAYAWCRVQVVSLGYLLSETHRVHSRLLDDNRKLNVELARLQAPERVERIAVRQLGLKHPSKNQIVVLP